MENKLEFNLKRTLFDTTYTLGTLKSFENNLCNTIEPSRNSKQLIPSGKYKVVITYSPRFDRDLPLLLDVAGFKGIRIHRGNSSKDTSGCILPGDLYIAGYVKNSTEWETKIINLIKQYKECSIAIS